MIFEFDCFLRKVQPLLQPNRKYRDKISHFLGSRTMKTLSRKARSNKLSYLNPLKELFTEVIIHTDNNQCQFFEREP